MLFNISYIYLSQPQKNVSLYADMLMHAGKFKYILKQSYQTEAYY